MLTSVNRPATKLQIIRQAMDAVSGDIGTARYSNTNRLLAGRMRHTFSPSVLAEIDELFAETVELEGGQYLWRKGDRIDRHAILVEGFMFRSVTRNDQRHIIGILVPGDLIDFHGLGIDSIDHDISAAGNVRLGLADSETLREAIRADSEIGRAVWLSTLLDAAMHREWVQKFERLDAPRRIAHVYSELRFRLALAGFTNLRTVRTTFTQIDLADMSGVSAIHANRAVAKLRELGLGEIRRGDFYCNDWDALTRFAGFDPAYLHACKDAVA